MMALMTNGVVNLHRPEAEKKHKKWFVVRIVVSVTLDKEEDSRIEKALQVKVKTTKFF